MADYAGMAIDNHTKGATPTREDNESRLGELSTGAIVQMEGKLENADGAFAKKDEPRRSRRR